MKYLLAILVVLPSMALAQTLKPGGGAGYDRHWRAMQTCLAKSESDTEDTACIAAAHDACLNAGVFEACLESLAKWVARDNSRMQRALGLLPDEGMLRDSACDGSAFMAPQLCRARDATGLLLDLRAQMRAVGRDPDNLEDPIFHPRPIEDCIKSSKSLMLATHCVGEGALACWHAEEGGGATDTIGLCLGEELDYWETRLTAVSAKLAVLDTTTDAQRAGDGFPQVLVTSRAELGRDWHAYRKARCGYVTAIWGQGSGSGVMWADCMVQATGGHVLWLEYWAENY